jgi:glycosyltransferase involved in cell wall biosynthesis
MRRLLFLAYHFPPLGGGGVQRSVGFVRHLPSFGYAPIVITGTGVAADRWSPSDNSLSNEIREDVEVWRVPGPEPPVSVPGWRGRVNRVLGNRSEYERWWIDGAVGLGRSVAGDVDAVFGELVPYTTSVAAARLSDELAVPWVADLQDPWVLDEMWLYPSVVHQRRDERRMRRLLGSASAIIMNTPEATERVRRRFPELAGKLAPSITNGFDEEDFVEPDPGRDPAKFRIVHSGYLHTESGYALRASRRRRRLLGGMPYPEVDFLPRSHVFLLEAIDRVIADDPKLANVIELHLAGVISQLDREIAARSPVCRVHGYLPHGETVRLVRSADLLFLPMHELPVGVRAGLVPGKAYEYLGARRPILAAVPDGDARDYLEAAGNATLCRPADVGCLAQAIRAEIDRWRAGQQRAEPDPEVRAQFDRRLLSERLAATIDAVVGASA